MSREALIARLERPAAAGVFQWEGNRRARVVEALDLARRQLAAQHVSIPAAVDVRERLLADKQHAYADYSRNDGAAFRHCDMVNTYIQCGWRLRNMATSIRLDPETEHRLDVLATQTGRTKAFYLREIIERGLEDLEDYYLAADVLERLRHGTENVYSSADVRHALHLDD